MGHDYDYDQIYEGLYQGALPPTGTVLKDGGIDVLVLCAAEWQEALAYEGVEVICAPGEDDDRPRGLARFIDVWKDAARQVATHQAHNKNVLVTCQQGWNRSGIVTALALQELTNQSGSAIVSHIQSCRQNALCNQTFADYIVKSFPETK